MIALSLLSLDFVTSTLFDSSCSYVLFPSLLFYSSRHTFTSLHFLQYEYFTQCVTCVLVCCSMLYALHPIHFFIVFPCDHACSFPSYKSVHSHTFSLRVVQVNILLSIDCIDTLLYINKNEQVDNGVCTHQRHC